MRAGSVVLIFLSLAVGGCGQTQPGAKGEKRDPEHPSHPQCVDERDSECRLFRLRRKDQNPREHPQGQRRTPLP